MRPGRAFLTTLALLALLVICLAGTVRCAVQNETPAPAPPAPAASGAREYQFDKTISREVLDNYLSRAWYFANTPSPSVPDGLGDEEAIRAIWTAEAAASN